MSPERKSQKKVAVWRVSRRIHGAESLPCYFFYRGLGLGRGRGSLDKQLSSRRPREYLCHQRLEA